MSDEEIAETRQDFDWVQAPFQAIEQALKSLGVEPKIGQPQPCLAWSIICDECTYELVRWTGIAFSKAGARALLEEHKAQAHR